VVPNLMTPENLAIAQKALDGFNAVLAKDPNDLTALKQIASIDRNIQKFDQAKAYEKKVIAVAPNDPEAYYTSASSTGRWRTRTRVAILRGRWPDRRRRRQREDDQGRLRQAAGEPTRRW
jgi:tetratricopeptide (TPR) repeat protein